MPRKHRLPPFPVPAPGRHGKPSATRRLAVLLAGTLLLARAGVSAQHAAPGGSRAAVREMILLQKDIADKGRTGQFAAVIRQARQGVRMAETAGIDSMAATFHYFTASAYMAKSLTDSAFHYFYLAERAALHPRANAILLRTWIQLIYAYDLTGRTDSAYAVLRRATALARQTTDRKTEGDMAVLQANLDFDQGSYPAALRAYIRAHHLYRTLPDKTYQAAALEGISLVEQRLGHFSKSLQYLHEARRVFQQGGSPDRVNNCNLTIGDLHLESKQYDSAVQYYTQVIRTGERLGEEYAAGRAYRGLAAVDEKKGDPLLAERHLLKALAIDRKLDMKPDMAETHVALGRLYLARQRFGLARQHFRLGLETKRQARRTAESVDIHRLLSETEARLGNFPAAYQHQQHYLAGRDSLDKQADAKVLGEIEARYQTERKQQQILLLNEKNRSQSLELAVQRRNVGLLVAGLLAGCIAGTVGYRRHRLRKRLEMEQVRSRIAADFHDEIGSSLSGIALCSDLLLGGHALEPDRSRAMLANISRNARSTVSSINDLIWTIKPDNDALEQTILRMKEFAIPLLEAKDMAFGFEVADGLRQASLDMNSRKFLYLIFKESVNNSLKYAAATRLDICLDRHEGRIRLRVADNGAGFDPAAARPGNGLDNMRRRAAELGGSLAVHSTPGAGTCVEFAFRPA